jgi:hypothetical protein
MRLSEARVSMNVYAPQAAVVGAGNARDPDDQGGDYGIREHRLLPPSDKKADHVRTH